MLGIGHAVPRSPPRRRNPETLHTCHPRRARGPHPATVVTLSTPPSLARLARHQCGLVTGAQCDAVGMDHDARSRRVRRGLWERPTRGVFDTAPDRPRGHSETRRRDVELALLAYGPGAVTVGTSSLVLHGNTGLPLRPVPTVALPGGSPRASRSGLVVTQHTGFTTTIAAGRPATTLDWAILQSVPRLDRLHLVAILDSALRDGLTAGRLEAISRGKRGATRLMDALRLADARSESILESSARLQCHDAGIPPDALQLPIRDGTGRVVARGDLAWRLGQDRWLVVEIDGQDVHGTVDAVYRDRSRQNMLMASGRYTVLRFTAADLARPGYVPRQIRAALRQLI